MLLKSTLNCFSELFFPRICVVCNNRLYSQEKFVCLSCQYQFPKTNFHLQSGNQMEQLFYGRTMIERASAFFEFQKGSNYQKILHQLKYKGMKELGEHIGMLYGIELKGSDFINSIDLILPVPLHPKKEQKRGYNQSYHLAIGLGNSLKIPMRNDILKRIVNTNTQTKRNRFERWQNVDGIFAVQNPDLLKNKHVLLVDDVVTTGATFEACVSAIKKIHETKISLLTLAIA